MKESNYNPPETGKSPKSKFIAQSRCQTQAGGQQSNSSRQRLGKRAQTVQKSKSSI